MQAVFRAALLIGVVATVPNTRVRGQDPGGADLRLLYVVCPGVRNDLANGGAGILVFDVDAAHKFVKRIATAASLDKAPENIKGVVASAGTRRLYFTTLTRIYCVDLVNETIIWEKKLGGGCDRPALTP